MSRATIAVEDPRGFEVGRISIAADAFNRLVTGHHLSIPLADIQTASGTQFSPEAAGFTAIERRQQFIALESEVDVFGGPHRRWRFRTNAFGARFVEAMMLREDALMFRFWIKAAAMQPGRVANFLAGCTSEDDYRTAIAALRRTVSPAARAAGGRG